MLEQIDTSAFMTGGAQGYRRNVGTFVDPAEMDLSIAKQIETMTGVNDPEPRGTVGSVRSLMPSSVISTATDALPGRMASPEGAMYILPPLRMKTLAEWHGEVMSIEGETFTAQLRGLFGRNVENCLEEAEIPTDEVAPEDRELLEVGAFFRLCVVYELVGSMRKRYTSLVFRRLPAYQREELESASQVGRELTSGIRLE